MLRLLIPTVVEARADAPVLHCGKPGRLTSYWFHTHCVYWNQLGNDVVTI